MDTCRYIDWLLRYTPMQNAVFSAGGQHQQILIFCTTDQLVAVHNICLLTVCMPPNLQKDTVMTPFRIYILQLAAASPTEWCVTANVLCLWSYIILTQALCAELCTT